jgi:hypothetical protein
MDETENTTEQAESRLSLSIASLKERVVSAGRGIGSGCALVWHKIQPGKRTQKPQQRQRRRSWVDNAIDNAFTVVTGFAFLAFLVASLPHVAYFFASFEPQDTPGTVSEWWWIVSYLIAGVINITEFLLSIKFARELHNATYGLPWYQRFLPVLGCVLKFWPFILIISGFSWAANLQHAREFHSLMLSAAESEGVTIPFMPYIKTWGDLNPYIVSAFPILNIAYTLMFDSSRQDEDVSVQVESTTALQPVSESTQVTLSDLQQLQAENLQTMKAIQSETVKALTTALQQFAKSQTPAQPAQRRSVPAPKAERKPEVKRAGSKYEEAITKLYYKDRQIKATEAARLVGCSHVTAGAILKDLRGVKITEVKAAEDERDTGKLENVSGGESA